jgi:hypothetical protein
VLSKIRGLRVASHTSAFTFKGSKVDIPTVAQKLNVATILEGSVRKFGKRVRITVQLVEVATDSHLWSDTYDRELEDIFAVQDDIAQSVVKELRSALLGEKRDSSAERRGEGGSAGRRERTRQECGGLSPLPAGTFHGGSADTSKRIDRHRASPASGEPRPGVCVGMGRAGVCPDDRGGIRGWTPFKEGYDALAKLHYARWHWSRILRRGTSPSRASAGDTTGIGRVPTRRRSERWSWRRETPKSCSPRGR